MSAGERATRWSALVRERLIEGARAHERMASDGAAVVADAVARLCTAIAAGGTVLICGNGGSAAESQHIAAEFTGRFLVNRRPLPAVALTTDTSALTAIGNDYGFEHVFARQVEAIGRRGDVLIGISTSGGSQNVVAAVEAARARGIVTIAVTGGDGGVLGRLADVHVNVPLTSTPRVQEVQLSVLHVICELVEQACATSEEKGGRG